MVSRQTVSIKDQNAWDLYNSIKNQNKEILNDLIKTRENQTHAEG